MIMSGRKEIPIEIDQEFIIRNVLPPPEIPKCSVAEYLSEKMLQWSKESLIGLEDAHTEEKLSYSDWLEKSKCFSKSLIDFGLKKNDLILMFGSNTIDYAVSMMGVIWMGLTFSPVTTANGQYELTQQIKDSQGSVLILDQEKLSTLHSAMTHSEYGPIICGNLKLIVVLNCTENDEQFLKVQNEVNSKESMSIFTFKQMQNKGSAYKEEMKIPHYACEPDDHFMIIYTSGTTGLPKGAIYSHYSTMGLLMNILDTKMKGMLFVLWYPFGHVSGTCFIIGNIENGYHNVLFRNVKHVETLLEFVQNRKVISLAVSPDFIAKMASNDYHLKYDLSSLKIVWTGGSKIPLEHIQMIEQKYKVVFIELFGATEFMTPTESEFFTTGHRILGSVGRPKPGIEMKIIDLKTGKNLPPNHHGEICVRGPQKFVGYLRNEQATKSAIDEDGWYHYGDVGYFNENGTLFFVDRIKELIKFREWSIFPSEIEDFMSKHEAVDSLCVIGVKHATDISLIRAYVKVKDGHQVTENELIKFVEDNMGFQKRLRGGVRFIEEMPRTLIGKVDRKYFRNLVKDELLTEPVE